MQPLFDNVEKLLVEVKGANKSKLNTDGYISVLTRLRDNLSGGVVDEINFKQLKKSTKYLYSINGASIKLIQDELLGDYE